MLVSVVFLLLNYGPCRVKFIAICSYFFLLLLDMSLTIFHSSVEFVFVVNNFVLYDIIRLFISCMFNLGAMESFLL